MVHRLVIDRLERVARGRQRAGQAPTDLEQLTLHRAVVGHAGESTPGTLRGMNREPELLSVVAPMYEEQETVDPFTERVAKALGDINYELILVNDGVPIRTRRMCRHDISRAGARRNCESCRP